MLNTFVASTRSCSTVRPARPDVAEHAQVDVAVARAVDDAAAGGAVGAERGLREGRGVEPLLDQLLARTAAVERGVADEVGAIVGEAVEVAVLAGA